MSALIDELRAPYETECNRMVGTGSAVSAGQL